MAKRKPDDQPSDPVRARSELVQQVQSGAMTPKDAETRAKRLGIAPLIAQPDPANFDPMNEVAWTLPMVAAWITFRSADKVREWWTPFRSKIRYWRELEGGGRELAARQPATLPHMILSDEPISSTHVMQEIKEAGRAGRIRVTGTCTRTNERREIQAIEWQDLEHKQTSGDCDALRFKRRRAISSHGYDDILFGRDEVLKEWPPKSGVMRTGLPGRPTKSREWIDSELERRIGEITKETKLSKFAQSILESMPSDYAQPTVGVIENRIRRRFNEAKARGRQP